MQLNPSHPFFASSNDIDQVCKPLRQLGITYFTYTRSYDDGNRVYLGNHPDVLENYLSKKIYLVGNVESKPSNYKPQMVFWSTLPKQYIYDENLRSRGIDHGIFIIQPHKGYCDFYGLATTKDNDRIINVYLSNADVLKNFDAYFKEQAAQLIKRAEAEKIVLPFHNDPLDFIDDHFTHHLNQTLYSKNASLQSALTKRQLECAFLLMQGKTAKEVATQINLSARTVESYLSTIKTKLACRNKSELIITLTHIFNDLSK